MEHGMNPAAFTFTPSSGQDRRHERLPLRFEEPYLPSTISKDSRSQVECRYFQRGQCRNGDTCRYLHANHQTLEIPAQSRTVINEPSPQENTTRTISGASVLFDAGAAVKNVSLPSDFSAVQISHLPPNSTRDDVLTLLRSHGFDTTAEPDIRITNERNLWSALVKVEDPEFAKLAAQRLGPQAASRQTRGSLPVATLVETPISSGSSTLRVDCKKVHVSWHKPCRTIWLNFGDHEIAKRVAKRFRDGKYMIRKQKVQCGDPTRGGGLYNRLAWTVCLTEVPASANKSDISESIRQVSDKPRGIELGKPSYDADAETCAAKVQSLFTSIGALEWWELTPDTTGKRMKASARFQDEDNARDAARILNDSAPPFHKTAKLTVQLVHTAKFKVHEKIYQAVESQIKANIRDWKASHLYFTAYENSNPPKWYRVLKVEGEDAKQVVAAKNTITGILSGIVAKFESSVLWHPVLRGNGVLFERVKQLEEQFGIAIIRSKAKSQLRLYGPPAKCEEVQAAIARLLKTEGSENFSIYLGADEFPWALREGFEKVRGKIGFEKAIFDITSTPKRIIIIGSAVDYETALSIMNNKDTPQKESSNMKKQDCSVCWTEAENPIQTQCGHVYCLDCFENLCISHTSQNTTTQVRCHGESGTCDTKLGLPELQEHLPSTAFEELLELSFASYVRLHPQSLKYCPSVDCKYVYRISTTPKMQTCPNCLVPICTACQVQHGTMTCAEYKDVSTGGYEAFQRLKETIGIKDCPQCTTPLEKIEGCNHMTCRCGAHICWVCLRTFKASKECYEHMNKEHNGIGLDHYRVMFGR